MKTILIIISSFGIGGAEAQTASLISNLKGFKIHILCLGGAKSLVERIDLQKVEAIQFLNKKSRYELLPLLVRARTFARSVAPDVIYCVNLYPILFGYFAKIVSRGCCRLIASIHTTEFRGPYSSFVFNVIYKRLINRVDHLIFVSQQQRNFWLTNHGVANPHTTVIHNGIDLERFKKFHLSEAQKDLLRSELGLGSSDLVLCMCTALRPEKNHLLALSALRRVLIRGIRAKLLIVGDGPMRPKLEKAIAENKLREHVFLVGSKDDVRPYLAVSDVFLLTSSAVETFSIAVLEAMAMGKPVLAPNIGGLSEQVYHGENGFLFEKNNMSQLVDYITLLHKERLIERMGLAGLRIVEQFDEKNMAGRYEDLFKQILGKRK